MCVACLACLLVGFIIPATGRKAPILVCLFACLFVCLLVCLCVCLFACLCVCLFACLFVCLFVSEHLAGASFS